MGCSEHLIGLKMRGGAAYQSETFDVGSRSRLVIKAPASFVGATEEHVQLVRRQEGSRQIS